MEVSLVSFAVFLLCVSKHPFMGVANLPHPLGEPLMKLPSKFRWAFAKPLTFSCRDSENPLPNTRLFRGLWNALTSIVGETPTTRNKWPHVLLFLFYVTRHPFRGMGLWFPLTLFSRSLLNVHLFKEGEFAIQFSCAILRNDYQLDLVYDLSKTDFRIKIY